jgi:hypothetical protein
MVHANQFAGTGHIKGKRAFFNGIGTGVFAAGGAATGFRGLARKTKRRVARRERGGSVGKTGRVRGGRRASGTPVKIAFNGGFPIEFLKVREGDVAEAMVVQKKLFL